MVTKNGNQMKIIRLIAIAALVLLMGRLALAQNPLPGYQGMPADPTAIPSPATGGYYLFKTNTSGHLVLVPYIVFTTVNNLPACTAANTDTLAGVTNCTSCQFGQTCTDAGSGGVFCPETCMVGGSWQAQ